MHQLGKRNRITTCKKLIRTVHDHYEETLQSELKNGSEYHDFFNVNFLAHSAKSECHKLHEKNIVNDVVIYLHIGSFK